MGKVRFVIQSSRSCFRIWKNAPRMLIFIGMITCFTFIYASPFAENAVVQGETLQCNEIFIALMNWRFTMLLFSTAILLLFGDLPLVEPFTSNLLLRGTRKSWIISQLLYIFVTTLFMTMFIFLLTILFTAPNINFSNSWSRPVKLLTSSGRIAIPAEHMKMTMPKSIVTNYSPWLAWGHSFALFLLMGFFYGVASLAFRMRFRSASFILLLFVNTLSWAADIFAYESPGYAIFSMVSVHYHASLYKHDYTKVNPWLPDLNISYVILICAVLFLIMLAVMVVKNYDYVQEECDQH